MIHYELKAPINENNVDTLYCHPVEGDCHLASDAGIPGPMTRRNEVLPAKNGAGAKWAQ